MADDPNKDDERDDEGEPKGAAIVEASFDPETEGVADPKLAMPLPDELDVQGRAPDEPGGIDDAGDEEGDDDRLLPAQMGYRRYIYSAFFVFAIALAYFMDKAGLALWHRLSQWTPKVGEPREDLVTPVVAVVAAVIIFAIYRRPEVQTLADEVALELSKVEWPTREKVRRSTTIVVTATLGSAFAFWIYDIGTNRAVSFVTSSNHPLLYGLAAGGLIYFVRAFGTRVLAGRE
jgi:preprotein translocase SecE subunit